MNKPIFENGITGLSDTKWVGFKGSAYRLVGIDFRSVPGIIKTHQKLKDSSEFVNEFCKNGVILPDGSKIWFSSDSGKIWKQDTSDVVTLLHTIVPVTDYAEETNTLGVDFGTSIGNKSYGFGSVLNPSGSSVPELTTVARTSGSAGSTTISINIAVPNESNMCAIVMTGSIQSTSYTTEAVSGVTFGGSNMASVRSGSGSTSGFSIVYGLHSYTGLVSGTNTVAVTFNASVSNRFLYVFLFKNTDQITPVASSDGNFGTSGNTCELQLPGTVNNQMRLGCFISVDTTHNSYSNQTEIIQSKISGATPFGAGSVSMRSYRIGTAKTLSASLFSIKQDAQVADSSNDYAFLEEKIINKIYYANENLLFAIKTDDISDWSNNIESVGNFKYGDDNYHPMVEQNLELFIGDDTILSKIDIGGNFTKETNFNINGPEKIQTLSTFDVDVLVGTKKINYGRVLRWDTFSDSWSADDEIYENGINAFIKDDNYVYVSAGDFGRVYFYNGEKLILSKRIPGDWDYESKAIINTNAVGFYMGNPVFGLSNSANNPALQGIYGFGGYDDGYSKALSLDYPIPTKEFEGVEIGCILIDGSDMYVSYKSALVAGKVAKIDHLNKYDSAYIETTMLTNLRERDNESIEEGICIDYALLPTATGVSISVKKKYDTNYTTLDTVVDTNKLTIQTKKSIPSISSLQIKLDFTVSSNDTPEIENIGLL